MGSRTIDTVIKLSGESEYRTQLKNCASELKLLKSDLDATTSEFRNNANSMEALTKKGEILADMYAKQQEKVGLLAGALENAKASRAAEEQQVAELKSQYDQAKKALASYGDEVDKNSQEYQEAKKQHDQLRDSLIQHQAKLDSSTAAVNKYSTQLNRAQIELDKLDDQVAENKKYLAEAESAADGCATSIDQYGKKVKETAETLDDASDKAQSFGDSLEDSGDKVRDLGDDLKDTGDKALNFGDILSADMISNAASSIVESLGEVVEETKEYRRIMASLEESSKDAGYSASETADIYKKLNGVLGDTQAAATTTANLQALRIEQSKLQRLTDGVIGSWAKYGDSIPIDGLAEAVNHTAQLGEVQGTLADVLEWGGISVDDFNEKLAACADAEERADEIAKMFAEQGLTQMGEAWQVNNEGLIASNEAAANMQEQLARLAELVEPVFTALTDLGGGLLSVLNDGIELFTGAADASNVYAEAAQNLNEVVATGNRAFDDSVASTEAAASTVSHYIDRLRELESQGLSTREAQVEYSLILEKINSLMPGLNAELDEQTGLVKGGTAALEKQAEAWKKNALAEAAYARYKDDIAAMADAEYEVAKNQGLLNMAREDAAEIYGRYETTEARLRENLQAQTDLANDTSLSYEEYASKVEKLQVEQAELEKELAATNDELKANVETQDQYKTAIEEGQKAVEENAEQVEAATKAYAQFSDQAEDTADTVGESAEDMASDVDEATREIMEAYESAQQSARESIDSQIGLFEDLSGKCEMSTQDMIDNLKSQWEAFENYADNIQLAMERGIDIGLVQQLSDGSVESMQILAELVTATDEEIAALNAEFQGVSEAKDYLSEGMATVSAEYLAKLVEMGVLTEEEAYEMGQQLVNGLISGVESKESEYTGTVTKLANAGIGAYKETSGIFSPSRRYRELAKFDVEGLVIQYQESKPKLEKAASELADTGYLSMIRARQAAIPSLTSVASSAQPFQDTRLYSLLQQLITAVKEGQVLAIDKNTFVGATAGAYDSKFGQLKILADRGAT